MGKKLEANWVADLAFCNPNVINVMIMQFFIETLCQYIYVGSKLKFRILENLVQLQAFHEKK